MREARLPHAPFGASRWRRAVLVILFPYVLASSSVDFFHVHPLAGLASGVRGAAPTVDPGTEGRSGADRPLTCPACFWLRAPSDPSRYETAGPVFHVLPVDLTPPALRPPRSTPPQPSSFRAPPVFGLA